MPSLRIKEDRLELSFIPVGHKDTLNIYLPDANIPSIPTLHVTQFLPGMFLSSLPLCSLEEGIRCSPKSIVRFRSSVHSRIGQTSSCLMSMKIIAPVRSHLPRAVGLGEAPRSCLTNLSYGPLGC